MKQITTWQLVLVALFLSILSGCEDETGKNLLELNKDNITLNHKDARETVTVTSGTAWEITGAPDWVKITPVSGDQATQEITVVADENNTFEQRTASLTFTNGHISRTLSITQLSLQEADAFIRLNQIRIEPSVFGNEQAVEITTNRPWKLENVPEWLSVTPASGTKSATITLKTKATREIKNRVAELVFTGQEKREAKLTVLQKGLKDIVQSPGLNLIRYSKTESSSQLNFCNVTTGLMFVKPAIKDDIFLGNLMNNNLGDGATVIPFTGYTFKPITVSTGSIIGGVYSKTFTPSLAEQTDYARHVTSFKPVFSLPMTSIDHGPVSFYSYRYLHLTGLVDFGVKLDEVVSGNSYTTKEMDNEYGLIFGFRRPVFSLVMDLPEDGTIINEKLKDADKSKGVSYVSGISYGQIGLLIMTSEKDLLPMKDIMYKVIKDKPLESWETSLIESAKMTYVYFDNNNRMKTVKGGVSALEAYKKAHSAIDYENIYPIAFQLADFDTHAQSQISYSVKIP